MTRPQTADDLIAAVIERSFETWLTALVLPGEETGTPLERVTVMAANVAKSLVDAPDFLSTPSPVPTVCSSSMRSPVTRSTSWRCSNCTRAWSTRPRYA